MIFSQVIRFIRQELVSLVSISTVVKLSEDNEVNRKDRLHIVDRQGRNSTAAGSFQKEGMIVEN